MLMTVMRMIVKVTTRAAMVTTTRMKSMMKWEMSLCLFPTGERTSDDKLVGRAHPPWVENVSTKRHLIGRGRGAGQGDEEGTSIPVRDENAATASKGERE